MLVVLTDFQETGHDHQLEFDLLAYLSYFEVAGRSLWSAATVDVVTDVGSDGVGRGAETIA